MNRVAWAFIAGQWVALASLAPSLAADAAFWAFTPPTEPALPAVEDGAWCRSPLDRFVLAGLEAVGLEPAPPADRRVLFRRASLDLTALPPDPDEVEAFAADDSPDAFAKAIERFLASPRYGERWGRHWLDIARYADSNGMDENLAHGNAYRYRDYVVAAFNSDKPFDKFVLEQLAGDLLPAEGSEELAHEQLVATGFLSIGPKMLAEDDPAKMEMDIVDEQLDTAGRAFLGMTFGCARCHDHKFDPFTTADYYALAGIFKSTKTMDHFKVVARWHERSIAPKSLSDERDAAEKQLLEKKAEVETRLKVEIDRLVAEGKGPFAKPSDAEPSFSDEARAALARLREEAVGLEKRLPVLPEAMAVEESALTNLKIHVRGSHWDLGPEVKRGFPGRLAGPSPPRIDENRSGRLELARWIATPENPLTSRVIANRIWRWRFGAGLVRTPDNFGRLGSRPDNPALLDWLALRLVESGWSIKALHRLILLSSTYQMSSRFDAKAVEIDPENRHLWRWSRHRLEAEAVRDSILFASGGLEFTMGGTLLGTQDRAYVATTASTNATTYASRRRSVYLPVIRSALYEVLQAFDFADPSTTNGDRDSTTVAPQALFLLNSDLMTTESRRMASRLLNGAGSDSDRIRRAYCVAFARPPSELELREAAEFLDRYAAEVDGALSPEERRLRAWPALARALLSSSELLHVD